MSRDQHAKHLKAALLGVALCMCLVLLQLAGGDAQRLVPPASETILNVSGELPRDGEARMDYDALVQNANFHAAFAMGDDGEYGWSDNYATQDMADFAALTWCEEDGTGCEIVARIGPVQKLELEGISLSKTAALAVEDYKSRPGSKALALSDTGAWGMAWNRFSAKEAATAAFDFCKDNLTTGFPDGRVFGTCRLVWFD
ncbi:MAG: hypothetical protein AAFN80_12415 [Pseudomonadota bacterium]